MSQIRPENRHRYPADWPTITERVKTARAAGRCECAGECGRPADHLAAATLHAARIAAGQGVLDL